MYSYTQAPLLLIIQQFNLVSLHAVNRFNIASSVPVNGEASIASLAQKSNLPEEDTRRIIRHAISNRIFIESSNGLIGHTAASKLLAQMPLLKEFINQSCDDMWRAAPFVMDAMEKWPGSEEPQHSAYNLAQQTDLGFFDHLKQSQARIENFNDSMTFFTQLPGFAIDGLLEAYDWSQQHTATVVDIGGSQGAVAKRVLEAFPDMHWTVQDLHSVVDSIENKSFAPMNLTFQAHNFFEEQPTKDADIYFLRMILHDWPDKFCVQILRSLIPALKNSARVLINDICIPSPGTLSVRDERNAR